MTAMKSIIGIEIKSMLEIPSAYDKAIKKFQDDNDNHDIWNGNIELKCIEFQTNFRRELYECIIEIEVI